jgi:hypothetical protein
MLSEVTNAGAIMQMADEPPCTEQEKTIIAPKRIIVAAVGLHQAVGESTQKRARLSLSSS